MSTTTTTGRTASKAERTRTASAQNVRAQRESAAQVKAQTIALAAYRTNLDAYKSARDARNAAAVQVARAAHALVTAHGGNKSAAARAAGVDESTIRDHVKWAQALKDARVPLSLVKRDGSPQDVTPAALAVAEGLRSARSQAKNKGKGRASRPAQGDAPVTYVHGDSSVLAAIGAAVRMLDALSKDDKIPAPSPEDVAALWKMSNTLTGRLRTLPAPPKGTPVPAPVKA